MSTELYAIIDELDITIVENSALGAVNSIIAITEESPGIIWLASEGRGVWKISEDTLINYTQRDGLYSDYCYGITHKNGWIYVSHRGGLSTISSEDGRINVFSQEEGIPSSAEFTKNAILNLDEHIWFGTSGGMLRMLSAAIREVSSGPALNVKRVLIDGDEMEWQNASIVLSSGFYDLQVDFVGIDFNNPEQVVYQTKLKGLSTEWSDLATSRVARYSRLNYGEYAFDIRAYDYLNNRTIREDVFQVHIRRPFYLLVWFWLVVVVVVFLLFYTILKARERAQKQLQANLERKLEERTGEVIRQKEDIERYNKEITESINYASKIQFSMMPPEESLNSLIKDSFIFYQPRSIVSGDFYWFDKLDDRRLLIVCADSTGHGVPGAFMSMIGITLIKDIVSHNPEISPGLLLNIMDQELRSTLSQKVDTLALPDGMDLTIAFLDRNTGELEIASAMNPYIIQRENEQIYQRASMYSLGGKPASEEKIFENKKFTLADGDTLYMFTDGYPDQFGGPNGKKFKVSGLKALIEELKGMEISRQKELFIEKFTKWKGEDPQIDDVLLMAVRK